MDALIVHGGKPLSGEITISGAKNAVLPILAATMLHGDEYCLHNCPDIADVRLAAAIIRCLGGRVTRRGNTLLVDTRLAGGTVIPADLMGKMRASVLFLGALLARFGEASMTMPGGCPLGRRPIDLHLDALARMGASVVLWEGEICCEAPALHGATIELQFPSVGATENVLLASMGCKGTVVLQNAAREPEIADLAHFLQAMGGEISGIGTDTLTIRGGAPLSGAAYTVMPDRIEAATFLCACAGCGGEICLHGADGRHLTPVLDVLTGAGCELCWSRKCITLPGAAQGRSRH